MAAVRQRVDTRLLCRGKAVNELGKKLKKTFNMQVRKKTLRLFLYVPRACVLNTLVF